MAASLTKSLGIDAKLIEGSGGVFDVAVADNVIFSKDDKGRFPTNEEVIDLVRENIS